MAGHSRRLPADPRWRESRTDLAMYAVAAVLLVVLGAWLRTPVLNWIVGPALVVVVVTLGSPTVERVRKVVAGRRGPAR